jgi:hypothetical protein
MLSRQSKCWTAVKKNWAHVMALGRGHEKHRSTALHQLFRTATRLSCQLIINLSLISNHLFLQPSHGITRAIHPLCHDPRSLSVMTDKLPPNLLTLFTPRPPLRYLLHADHAPGDRHTSEITGVGTYLQSLQEYKQTDEYSPTESWLQRRDRIRAEKREKQAKLVNESANECESSFYG